MPDKVYDLAKEFKMTNTEMVNILGEMGRKNLSPSSDLDEETARAVRERMRSTNGTNGANAAAAPAPAAAKPAAPAAATPTVSGEAIEVPANVTIKELADRLGVPPSDIQKVLMSMGVLAALNQRLAADAILRISQKLGKPVRTATATGGTATTPRAAGAAPAATPATPTPSAAAAPAIPTVPRPARVPSANRPAVAKAKGTLSSAGLAPRPPVVTVMGHVDHGKTTLLDALRKTTVASGEAGGITQHIGAYQVEIDGKRITFLDTPGHAAFSSMRARGARVTDIVVLVVAADDSIKPQTEEAIKHARAANVPIVVAINKIDLPDANPEKVMTDLASIDLVPEAFGGTVQTVPISAKTGEGLPQLLETLLLVSELEVDPKANPQGNAQGVVVEARIDKGRGPVVTVLVQQGALRRGDIVVAGEHMGKIRAMTDDKGVEVKVAGPSTPVEIVGLGSVPGAGDRLEVVKDEKEARVIVARREDRNRDQRLGGPQLVSLEALYKRMREGEAKELNVVIKADVQGSVEAVRESLEGLGNDEVRVRVLHSGVGPIGESDVLLAASDKDHEQKNALVVGFNVGSGTGADKKAEQEHVQVRTYSIIYNLIDDVTQAMIDLLPPIYEENELGKAEVRALFRLPKGTVIAGCYVVDGLVRRNAKARVRRGTALLATADVDTLRRIKDDVREVQSGYECGLTLRDFNDIQAGDILECFEMRQIPRVL